MTDRELMQQALDALEVEHSAIYGTSQTEKAIEALRARLAQPEQEPVACPYCHYSHTLGAVFFDQNCAGCVNRMTTPPQREWQTLTENEIKHLWYEACQTNLELTSQLIVHLARNIEAKLKEKNT